LEFQFVANDALPGSTGTAHENLIPTVRLPDPDDHHVAAVEVSASASKIIIFNARDFPAAALTKYGLHEGRLTADDRAVRPRTVVKALSRHRRLS
jgi:hypothetical protein